MLVPPLFPAVSNIFDVKLNSSEPVKALKGQRLVLNCTATAELNSRANISWDYPGKVRTTLLYLPHKGVITAFTHSELFGGLVACSKAPQQRSEKGPRPLLLPLFLTLQLLKDLIWKGTTGIWTQELPFTSQAL